MTISHRQQAAMDLVEVAAAAAETRYWTQALPGTYQIERVYFTPHTARVLDDTNYTAYSVDNGGVVIASDTTETTGPALVAGTPVDQTFAATGIGVALELAQGATLAFKKVDTGTGLALDGTWNVSLVQIRD